MSLDGPAADELSVAVTVTETGAMQSGTPPASVAFAAGDRTKTLTLATAADAVIEPDSTVTATLEAGSGYTLGATSSAEVTVADNDMAEWRISAEELKSMKAATPRWSWS